MSEPENPNEENQTVHPADPYKPMYDVVCAGVDYKFWHKEFLRLSETEGKSSKIAPEELKKLQQEQSEASGYLRKSREELFRTLEVLEKVVNARITGEDGTKYTGGGS